MTRSNLCVQDFIWFRFVFSIYFIFHIWTHFSCRHSVLLFFAWFHFNVFIQFFTCHPIVLWIFFSSNRSYIAWFFISVLGADRYNHKFGYTRMTKSNGIVWIHGAPIRRWNDLHRNKRRRFNGRLNNEIESIQKCEGIQEQVLPEKYKL